MACNSYSTGSGAPILFGGTLDPAFCHVNWPDTFAAFRDALIATLPGNYAGIVVGSTTPAVSDRDKLWFKAADNCEPLGLFAFYGGRWVRSIPHPMLPGFIVDYWTSSLSVDTHEVNAQKISFLDVYDEVYGVGTYATNPFWRVCDGSNGTPDLQGRITLGAGIGGNDGDGTIGGTNVPLSDRVSGQKMGKESITLQPSQIPNLTIPVGPSGTGVDAVIVGGPATAGVSVVTSNTGSGAHDNMPPAFVCYKIIRTSRRI